VCRGSLGPESSKVLWRRAIEKHSAGRDAARPLLAAGPALEEENMSNYPSLVHEELPQKHDDPLIRVLHRIIRGSIRVLAVLMVLVIMWGIGDVVYVLYQKAKAPPVFLLNIHDIFETFGAFMAVLIAVEIFVNIRLYLGSDVLPVQLVVATALMAIARKVIVLDVEKVTPDYVLGIAAVTVALGLTHWLVGGQHEGATSRGADQGAPAAVRPE
jgi:uncharacterized membrane protein (DUF373 family)